MTKKDFSINYNGHPVHCVDMGDQFLVQITYKSILLERQKDAEGNDKWLDGQTKLESGLAVELGKLIREQYLD